MTKLPHDGVALFTPHEVSKAEGDMATFVIPHILAAMLEAEEQKIPIETIVRGLCALAGTGLAQIYADDPKGGNYALQRCVEVMQENYRISTADAQTPEPCARPAIGDKVRISSDDWATNGKIATVIDPEPYEGSSRLFVAIDGWLAVVSLNEIEEIR